MIVFIIIFPTGERLRSSARSAIKLSLLFKWFYFRSIILSLEPESESIEDVPAPTPVAASPTAPLPKLLPYVPVPIPLAVLPPTFFFLFFYDLLLPL